MRVEHLFTRVRDTLQDLSKTYWTDPELLNYYNECKRNMSMKRQEDKTTASLTLDVLKSEYDTSGVLRYIRAVDDLDNVRTIYQDDESGVDDEKGIIILNYNKILVNDPTIGTTITMSIIASPSEDNLDNSVRDGDENAFKYYILSKAYEKDTDMENFQKADYFYRKYNDIFVELKGAKNINYIANTLETNKSYYY